MTVLAIVQTWNHADPIRGFIVPWMEALAERVDRLVILTLEQCDPPSRDNIFLFSLGKEHGGNRIGYLAAWHRAWRQILDNHPPDLVFAHMSPIFAILSAPYAKPRRIPIVTWFAHRHVSPTLKLAHQISSRVLTINRESYPYGSGGVSIVGHGIDCDLFKPDGRPRDPHHLISVGRVSPIKDAETLLRAIERLRRVGHPVTASWIGEPPARDNRYGADVTALRDEISLKDAVRFEGSIRQKELPEWYNRCAVHVNLCPTGALDKAALESMACGTPTLVANEAFRLLLGDWADLLLFRHRDVDHLAHQLSSVLALEQQVRQRIADDLRRAVIEQHSLGRLWDRLIPIFEAEISHRQTGHGLESGS